MTAKELKTFLTDDVRYIEIEDTDGDTVLFINLDDISIADVDEHVLRIQGI